MICIDNLSKSFGNNQAVKNVNLQLEKQDILGLVGPDGAGKTTLLRMICGLITPDSGQVLLLGLSPEKIEKDKLGYMPQSFSLYGDLNIRENIHFFGSMYGIKKETIRQRADQILEITRLKPFEERLASDLSGGMKQKLALTCALITRPEILVLDEPTYGFDPESRKEFWRILYDLNQEGMTILLSTPYMDEAELCKKVAFINEGVLVTCNSPTSLKSNFPYQVLEIRAEVRDPYFFDTIPGVLDASFYGYKYHLLVKDIETDGQLIKDYLEENNIKLISMEEISPSMEDLFVILAESGTKDAGF